MLIIPVLGTAAFNLIAEYQANMRWTQSFLPASTCTVMGTDHVMSTHTIHVLAHLVDI